MIAARERREHRPGAFAPDLKGREPKESVIVVVRHRVRRDRFVKIEPGKSIRHGR